MDFDFTDEQLALADLARQILDDKATPDRLKELERGEGQRFDPDLWASFADAGLIGVALPEAVGGGGYGLSELAAILEQVGRTTAPIPLFETVALAGLALARFGTAEQQSRYLTSVVAGELVLTGALQEEGAEPLRPVTTAHRADGTWRVSGTKLPVPYGQIADHVLVPAATSEGTGLFLIAGNADGVGVEPLQTTDGAPAAEIVLEAVEAEPLGEAGGDPSALDWLLEQATAAQCALALGVCEEALRLTAEYTKERRQFDVPIASFQAVGHRAADAYVDVEAIRLTAWQAIWRLSEGLPATAEVAVAKYWAAEGGQRVVLAAQHLHGGVGVDRDYPLHRYFLAAKRLELDLGGGTAQLRALGRILADEPV
ncbi:MAG: Acyl-CoA dehydrogenase FadE27 [Acidimicrobiales bacterium]|nr:MAG: acyl-CoA dehydrogenase [Actinomycetota bacterium]MBV6507241.1 Acyl-CoA dehydrogenase FadE27 [Acidimicrobiales bacterium]RIK05478.1 MAG: acyl-CoA dehydrogenase [Acidobacteriota bacterium]